MRDDFKPDGLMPEVEAASNFPLFEVLTNRLTTELSHDRP